MRFRVAGIVGIAAAALAIALSAKAAAQIPGRVLASSLEETTMRPDGRTIERHALSLDGIPIANLSLKFAIEPGGERRPRRPNELPPGVEAASAQPTLSRAEAARVLAALPGHSPFPGEAQLLFLATFDRQREPDEVGGPFVRRVSGLRLVWQVALHREAPFSPATGVRGPSAREIATIDAHTGELLEIVDNRIELEAVGHGFHNPLVLVEATATGNAEELCLGDRTRPNLPWSGYGCVEAGQGLSVSTYRGPGMGLGPVLDSADLDGVFGDGNFATSETPHFVDRHGRMNAVTQTSAVDALYGVEKAYDFFRDVFGRSTLGRYGQLSLHVNIPPSDDPDDPARVLNNAWVERLDNSIWVGLSDASHPERRPAADLESMGHEYAHLVLASAVGYPTASSDADAIHEGFADIMGLLSATWTWNEAGNYPSHRRLEPEQWVIGDAVSPDLEFHRFFHRPSLDGRSVNALGETNPLGVPYDQLEGHHKAGVLRRWFYFLAKGVKARVPLFPSPADTDFGSPYLPRGLQGIGVEAAAQILYDLLVTEGLWFSDFSDLAFFMEVLNPEAEWCSPTEKAVHDAWAAVNVGVPVDRDAPVVTLEAHQQKQVVRLDFTADEEIKSSTLRLAINGIPAEFTISVPAFTTSGVIVIPVGDARWNSNSLQTLTLTMEDDCRNATSTSIEVAVDRTPPSIGSVTDETPGRTPVRTFRFEASDLSGVASLRLTIAGSTTGDLLLVPPPKAANRIVTFNPSSVAHGVHFLEATATDVHGNVAMHPFPGYLVDRLPPERCELVYCGPGSYGDPLGSCILYAWDGLNDDNERTNRNGVQQVSVVIDNAAFLGQRWDTTGTNHMYFSSNPLPVHWVKYARSPTDLTLGDHTAYAGCVDGWGNFSQAPTQTFHISDRPVVFHSTSWSNGTYTVRARGHDEPDSGDNDSIQKVHLSCRNGVDSHTECPPSGPPCRDLEAVVSASLAAGQSENCDALVFDIYGTGTKEFFTITSPSAPPSPQPPSPGTGDISFRLIWHGTADLDLYVKEPNGNVIYYGTPTSTTGGRLDVDANAPCGDNQTPIENVFWPTGTAPHGGYEFWVHYYGACGDSTSQEYSIEVRQGTSIVATQSGWVDLHRESNHYIRNY